MGAFEAALASFDPSGFFVGVKVLDALAFAIRLRHSAKANLASALEAMSRALQNLVDFYHADEGHALLEIIPLDLKGVVSEVLGPFGQAPLDLRLRLVCEVIRGRRLLRCRLRSRNCTRRSRTGALTSPTAPFGQHNLEVISHLFHEQTQGCILRVVAPLELGTSRAHRDIFLGVY